MEEEFTKVIYSRLKKKYPNVKSSLNFTNPIECWASVVLSAQCTDKRVNLITPKLFRKYKTFYDYSKANEEELKEIIKPCGYYNAKSKYLIKGAQKFIEYGYINTIPANFDQLITIPGIGSKTANVIFSNTTPNNAGIAIDTHNKRVLNRLGLVSESNPKKIESKIKPLIKSEIWREFSLLVIEHGRDTCKARKPLCEQCILKDICHYYNNTLK